jgi:3'(2'), 5'-bisphosphate nucleotidase
MQNLLAIAVEAALDAGRQIMEIYASGDFNVELKGDDSPLTRADVASHHAIMAHLESTGIPVLSEEGRSIPFAEREAWSRLWIVDPIDGTKEFIKRNGEFTVNIALVEDGIPTMGVVYVPAKQELFVGVSEGENACATRTVDGDDGWSAADWLREGMPIPAPAENRPFTVVASRSHMSPETSDYINQLKSIHGDVETISKGSSLKLCMVAAGEADCYPRFAPTMEWDTAAGQGVCLAAGCDVLNWETKKPLTYNRKELLNPWFLVRGPRMTAG